MGSPEKLQKVDENGAEGEYYPCEYFQICGHMITVYSESVFASLMCDECRDRVFKKKPSAGT